MSMGFWSIAAAASAALGAGYAVDSQATPQAPGAAPAASALTYADTADLALAAAVAAHVRVVRAAAVRERDATGVSPGYRRFLVEADVVSLIRAPAPLPARVRWLIDLPNDSRGRAARLPRRTELLVLASAVPDRAGELRLVAADAQLPYAAATAERVRAILREASQPNPAPRITAVGRAFHVAGAVAGESETQIFLQTANERPISLSVLRRPGEQPRWAASLGEIVDENAAAPRRDTLLWYRLACTLPRTLPQQSLAAASAPEAAAIAADYRLVIEALGPCTRTRARP
jgi:hypothetical protein